MGPRSRPTTAWRHLLEEAYEAVTAIDALPADSPLGEPDVAAYLELEEELGDLLLQVVFHATLAAETGLFGIEEVAEAIRRKLVARHPHVFGGTEAETADEVLANWDRLKTREKGRESLLDGVPAALPSLARRTRCSDAPPVSGSTGRTWPVRSPRCTRNSPRLLPTTPITPTRSAISCSR